MEMELRNAGKRYRFDWIFRAVNFTFNSDKRYALLGPNGSGKSTLLKALSGHLSLTKGELLVRESTGRPVAPDEIYKWISLASPYLELIEEFTLHEAVRFHAGLKPMLPGANTDFIIDLLALPKTRHKELRYFSSGMKQRVKLALAVCSGSPILLLDEPTTNLDLSGINWYKSLVEQYASNRLVIIATNDPADVEFCSVHLNIMDYKPGSKK